jgi:hypothetical protein
MYRSPKEPLIFSERVLPEKTVLVKELNVLRNTQGQLIKFVEPVRILQVSIGKLITKKSVVTLIILE